METKTRQGGNMSLHLPSYLFPLFKLCPFEQDTSPTLKSLFLYPISILPAKSQTVSNLRDKGSRTPLPRPIPPAKPMSVQ
jgi:hypothetical protein